MPRSTRKSQPPRPLPAGGGSVPVDDLPVLRLAAPNITPAGVVAGWSVADWDRIVRHGVLRSGRTAWMRGSKARTVPLSASSATRALNSGSCLLRFAFILGVFGSFYRHPPHTTIIA